MAKQDASHKQKQGEQRETDKNRKNQDSRPEPVYEDIKNTRAKGDDQAQDRRAHADHLHTENSGANGNNDNYRSTNLRDSVMMAYLLDNLEQGTDIGHYGRLVFVMVARHFMSDDEILNLLSKQPGYDETEARAHLLQVKERDYNPPRPERIRQWQERQEFVICPEADDPNGCNVYRELQFPERIYDNIEDFWEERADSEENS